jgi:hypothetical protein
MRPDRVQIEPAGVTTGKSFSGSNTLLKKFVREYMAICQAGGRTAVP